MNEARMEEEVEKRDCLTWEESVPRDTGERFGTLDCWRERRSKFREGSGVRLWFGLNHKPRERLAVVAGGGSRVISTDLWFIFSNI